MTDSPYASSPEMPHRTHPTPRSLAGSKAITTAAGAGFRLSLALNAVGTESAFRHEMASNDIEIQIIAKKISDFSIMLKQVGRIVEDHRTIASNAAIDTVTEIKDQSERDFEEIKGMIEMVQKRDEEGHFRGIQVAQRVTWSFKKRKMQYLLGQLEYLKDSLAIMLQTLQLGKEIASAYEGKSRPPTQRSIEQERAEIQNMIIVQHWSMIELQKLYGLAEKEAMLEIESPEIESPPPSYDAQPPGNHLTITIGDSSDTAKETTNSPPRSGDDSNSRAMVTYQQKPLTAIRDSCERVMVREEEALGAHVPDIVDHLLDEWTQVGVPSYYRHRRHVELPAQHHGRRNRKYHVHVESDESDTSEHDSDYERSENIGGYYIEGPRSAVKKNVRFRASVEEEEDEEYHRPRKTTKKHTLGHINESSSESDHSPSPPVPLPLPSQYRRPSTSSNGSHAPSHAGSDRQPRPYSGSSYERRNSSDQANSRPGSSRDGPQGAPPPFMTTTSGPPPPLQQQYQQQGRPAPTPMPVPMPTPRPMQTPGVPWPNQGPGYPPVTGLRPPSQAGPPPPRMPSAGSYKGASPGTSPVTPQSNFFPAAPGGPGPRGVTPQQPGYPPMPPTQYFAPNPQQQPYSTLPAPPAAAGGRHHSYPNAHNSYRSSHRDQYSSQPQQQQQQQQHRRRSSSRHRDRDRDRDYDRDYDRRNSNGRKEESKASRNVKNGILGGTAIAGVMEILKGLDGL